MTKKKPKNSSNVIARNKRASFDFQLLETFEAGVVLSGWEVKSLRMGKADLADSYVLVKDGEAWLLGSQIVPLNTASTHFVTDPTRTRKLLLHKKELAKILAATAQKGLT
ncbi:MAG: SsrA-binding protein SmpB, partial [Gammaproteobacteria bacterium]|nr:SsrA-binding protein SmpB [Gammaproteobacteria bacterium]